MKVLVIHCAYACRGGEDTVVSEEIKLLRSEGVEVDLLLFNNRKNAVLNFLQLPYNIGSYWKALRKIMHYKPDIVHIHNLHFAASPSVLYAVKRSRTPFVVTLHNYRLLCPSGNFFHNGQPFPDSMHENFPWTAVRKGVYRHSGLLTFWLGFSMRLHRSIGTWKMCGRYIVVSERAKEIFTKSGAGLAEKKLVVKPNFHSHAGYSSMRTKDFLYAGRLCEEKGVSMMIKAFSGSACQLNIAGDGPLRNKVIAAAAAYKNIRYLGNLAEPELLNALKTCAALVFPSISHEGMPMSIIEALSCGTPVIASRLGIMETMITDQFNGLHTEPGDHAALRRKVEEWDAMDEKKKEICRQHALESYQQYYTSENNAKQLLHIYMSVILEREDMHVPGLTLSHS